MKPRATVQTRKLDGSPHVVHSLMLGDVLVYRQLSPFTDAEIAERVAQHTNPPPELPPAVAYRGYSAGRPKNGARKPDAYDWRDGRIEE